MNVQLTLIESVDAAEDWKLDTETREIGRLGLQSAREALASARAALNADTTVEITAGIDVDDFDQTVEIELPAAA